MHMMLLVVKARNFSCTFAVLEEQLAGTRKCLLSPPTQDLLLKLMRR